MKKLALHTKILLGMLLGFVAGFVLLKIPGGDRFNYNWIAPWGKIFINLLKLIAIPLILASLVKGVSDLQDIAKFKTIGLRTVGMYITTTVTAIVIGLLLVNLIKPGEGISRETVEKLKVSYAHNENIQTKISRARQLLSSTFNISVFNENIQTKISRARQQQQKPALQFLVDMVPDNIFKAMSDNRNMLQVIFFALFLGIALILIPGHQAAPLKEFFDSFNEVILKMVDLIMLFAPYAVFALIANVIVTTSGDTEILQKLLLYAGVVVTGLILMIGVYMLLVRFLAGKNPFWFLRQLLPAQLLAFSSSSSAATLPVTMERVEEHIGVDKEVAGFVLPVGATVNMDGTSLYQAVAAVFIMQVFWPEGLGFANQITIILTALLASIGAAAVPGAGMIMLVIVLDTLGFPSEQLPMALALIFAIDRPLDMLRTVINITGDATVATVVAKSVGKLHKPHPKEWDDYLKK